MLDYITAIYVSVWTCASFSWRSVCMKIYLPSIWISLATRVILVRKWQCVCVWERGNASGVIACDITTLISFLVIIEAPWTERLNNEKAWELRLHICYCWCVCVCFIESEKLMSICSSFLDEFLNWNCSCRFTNTFIKSPWDLRISADFVRAWSFGVFIYRFKSFLTFNFVYRAIIIHTQQYKLYFPRLRH